MQLIHRKIPAEFLDALPEGMKFIHRQGQEFLVVEELFCPKGHSLMADSVKIHGESSIRIKVHPGDIDGLIFLDAFWGSHARLFSFFGSTEENSRYLEAFCATCGASLAVDETCTLPECGSPKSLALHLPGGKNRIYVCSRLGCPGHRLAIAEVPSTLNSLVSEINYFGHGEEEIFGGV